MTTSRLRWIIVLMSTAAIGLITFQWYWVDTIIDSNEDRFSKDVLSAMNMVIQKLELQEVLLLVNQNRPNQRFRRVDPAVDGHPFQTSGSFFYEATGNLDSSGFNFFFSMDANGSVEFFSSDQTRFRDLPKLEDPLTGVVDDLRGEQLEKLANKSEMVVTVMQDLLV